VERLGETDAFAQIVIQLLQDAGWTVQPPRPAIGGGSLWMATRLLMEDGDELVVCQTGERFVDVAAELLTDALRALELSRQPIVFSFDVQLQLPIAA